MLGTLALGNTKDKVRLCAHGLLCVSLSSSSAVTPKGRLGIAWLHDGVLPAGKIAVARVASSREGRAKVAHGRQE